MSNSKENEMIIEHRRQFKTFDPNVAEVVGVLRKRASLIGECTKTLKEQFGSPKRVIGLSLINLADMKPDVINVGRVLPVTIIDVPQQYEFETSDLYTSSHISVMLLVRDGSGNLQRAFIYNSLKPDLHKEYEDPEVLLTTNFDGINLRRKFEVGFKINIVDPEVKTASDGKLALVINDSTNLVSVPDENITQICRFCFKGNAESRCTRCKTAYYCTKECQSQDWVERKHKLICITEGKIAAARSIQMHSGDLRPNWTVYKLEDRCYLDEVPTETGVRADYGFARCSSFQDECKLLGLYQGMIKIMRVDMVKFHMAFKNNELEIFIKQCFKDYGRRAQTTDTGIYYQWFVNNTETVGRF